MKPNEKRPRILLVEDSAEVRILSHGLVRPFADMVSVGTAVEARVLVESEPFDLVLIDVGLPDDEVDGFDVLGWVRNSSWNADTEVFFTTGRSGLSDRLRALRCGADDYITKPFASEEFVARIQAALRRRAASSAAPGLRCSYGDVVVDYRLMRVSTRGERNLHLTPNEFRLIAYLLEDPGAFKSREVILRDLWSELGVKVTERTVDTHICSLRKKLGELGDRLESIPSLGYRFLS